MHEMIRTLDPTDADTAAQIVSIQRAAYAMEAQLMSFDAIPPLHETVDDIQVLNHLSWRGAFVDNRLVGIIAWESVDKLIDIDRLAVDPGTMRQGIGRTLVHTVPTDRDAIVSTGTLNTPALALYESEGFRPTGQTEVAPDVWTTQLKRPASRW